MTKPARRIPFDFVLDELRDLRPRTRPLFSATAVYVGPQIVFALRDGKPDDDNGVWVATTVEHHASLRRDLTSLRSIGVLGAEVTGWQIIPVDSDDFEEDVVAACRLVRARDPRIGKVPKPRRAKKTRDTRKR